MSFFKEFPKTLIDINEDGAVQRITDIFKYVDVTDEKDDLYAYEYVDILNGERPDVLSQRLYGTPDYYWTFFITNDVLKGGGMSKWPQSALQYDEWLTRVYGDYGVISFPRGFAGFNGIDFDDSDHTDKLYLVATDTVNDNYGLIRIVDYDADRMQLWVDKTEQYAFIRPIINRSLSTNQLALWYPLAASTDVDTATNSVIDAATDSDYGGDLVGNTTGALGPAATHPLWDDTVKAFYFDGIDAYVDVDAQDSQLFTDSDIDLPTMLRDNQDWTIAFWYKGDMGSGASADSEAENGVLVGSTNQSGEPSSCIAIIDGKLSVVVVNNDSDNETAATSANAQIYQHGTINDNKWHHCLVSNDGSTREMDIFVDDSGNVVNKDAELDAYHVAGSTARSNNGIYFINANNGWAVGQTGTILKTVDGGDSWTDQTDAAVTSSSLYSVHFTDDYTGWAVGSSGTILHTTNGGDSWVAQTSGTGSFLKGVHFDDANNGWAVGSSGTILHTSNGGANWAAQTSGTGNQLNGVHFINANDAWVAGASGTILHTTDGGATAWTDQSSGAIYLNGIHFTDANNGWVAGASGTILKTVDGGDSWVAQTSGTGNQLRDVHFADANNGWAVGDSGTILHTSNGGANWAAQTSRTGDTLFAVHFIDSDTGWIAGSYGTILNTNDGGDTWQVQFMGATPIFNGVFLVEHLMKGDITVIDSDDATADEPIELDTHTRGYMKDFRIYLRQLTSAERRAASDGYHLTFGSILGTAEHDFDISALNASSAYQDLFFGWDRSTYNSQPHTYTTIAITGDDSDNDVWGANVWAAREYRRLGYSIFTERLAAYDYWDDATTAPSTYFPVYAPEETEIHNDAFTFVDAMVPAIFPASNNYKLIGPWFTWFTPIQAEVTRINVTPGPYPAPLPYLYAIEISAPGGTPIPFSDMEPWYGIPIETEPGWVYTLFGTGWPDAEFNNPVTPETLGPWDETDSDSWPTGSGSGGFANYVPPSVIGDGTTKIIWLEMSLDSETEWPYDAHGSHSATVVPDFAYDMKFRAVTETAGVEVAVRSSVKVGDNYNITFQSEIGKRYVLFTSNTVGGTYADSTTARHILGDGGEKTFTAYAIYQGMASGHDGSVLPDTTLINYFKIYSYVSIPEYSADSTKIATASNSLYDNRNASVLQKDQLQRYGSARWRSPNYVSYKEAHDIEQEDRRRIRVVRAENIQGFAEEYSRLVNL